MAEVPRHPKPQTAAKAPTSSVESTSPVAGADAEPSEEREPLRLDHFLKLNAMSESGGQAKALIQSGEVKVNGEVETRRRRKLHVGDVVELGGKRYTVESFPTPE